MFKNNLVYKPQNGVDLSGMAELLRVYRMKQVSERLWTGRSFVSDVGGSVPLRIAPLLILGLSIIVLVIMYVTTV